MKPRVPPAPAENWSEPVREILASTTPAAEDPKGEGPPNILYTIAHHPDLLPPLLAFSATIAMRGVLPRRDSELLALRASLNCRSAFEWGHHVEYGLAAGLGQAEVDRIVDGPDHSDWPAHDRLLLRAADELHAQQQLTDETFQALQDELDPAQIIELCFVVGHYTMLSMVANATGVPIEERLPAMPRSRRSQNFGGGRMRVTIFGATGLLGRECLSQCLEAGHEVTVLARTPTKLPVELRDRINIIEGDGLDPEAVDKVLAEGADAILFAIGIDKHSPEDLCTDVTRNILTSMRKLGIKRFVWCGGGNTMSGEDVESFGSKFVGWFSRTFMALRHRDKLHQIELLTESRDIEWIGIRPLQMRKGPRRREYRVGFHRYSGLSKVTAGDCAHEMIRMLSDDTWLHRAPVIQY